MLITIHGSKKKTRKQREKESTAWKQQQEKYKSMLDSGVSSKFKSWTPEIKKSIAYTLDLHKERLPSNLPSKDSGIGVASKKEANTYTGDKIIGIGNLHKSNLVPVFKEEDAKDLASMRR
jgi:hypothetical protein